MQALHGGLTPRRSLGCQEAALLAHCRGPGGHVRGCWALDAILGKP